MTVYNEQNAPLQRVREHCREIRQMHSAASCGPLLAKTLQNSEKSCKKGGE